MAKKETLLERTQKAQFPRIVPIREVVEVIPIQKPYYLELWNDGTVTWVEKKKENKDGT